MKLIKNNSNRDWSDLEWIEEFYKFLQGEIPEGMVLGRGHKVKLSPDKAYMVIWYLQEHFSLLPDHIEKCYNCDCLFDTNVEGYYWEKKGRHYCNGCEHLAPCENN